MKKITTVVGFAPAIAAALVVAGCGSGSSSDNTVIVNGEIARLSGPADAVGVSGCRGGEEWRASLPLGGGRRGEGMGVLWARRKIESLLDSVHGGANPGEVRTAVVALGLAHHLVTPHTSLVAVDVTPGRPDGAPLDAQAVATNLPHGWSYDAVFGELPQTATPLPAHAGAAGLALLFAGALWLADRRFRSGGRS